MKIIIGNDHTGVEMKLAIKNYLQSKKIEVIDLGNNNGISCNYAEIGFDVAKYVVKENCLGIVICGTGVGISIAANKVSHARAALVYETQLAELVREHNSANILALGARIIAEEKALKIVEKFINAKFDGGRHQERVNSLNEYKN